MAEIHKLTKDGQTIYPISITDTIVHKELKAILTNLIHEYNISDLFPTEGIDSGNKYTLELAISKLDSVLSKNKTKGTKIMFYDETNSIQEYIFTGDTFNDTLSWEETGISKINKLNNEITELKKLVSSLSSN